MSFRCNGARLWVELDVECIYCKHKFKVEYATTDKYAYEKSGDDLFRNGGYKMCPNPDCRILSTGMQAHFKDGTSIKVGKGFQDYCCPARDGGPGENYLHVYNDDGVEIMMWRRYD